MRFGIILTSLISVTVASNPLLYSCIAEIPPDACALKAENALLPRNVRCNVNAGALKVLKGLGAPATTFCSSYLRIPCTTTVTSTTTPPLRTTTSLTTQISTVLITAPTIFDKRGSPLQTPYPGMAHDLAARSVPRKLLEYGYAPSIISSACSCLSIRPKATTTVIKTAPTPVTTRVSTVFLTTTIRTCTVSGGPCECFNPGACCGGGCSCQDNMGNPVSTCF